MGLIPLNISKIKNKFQCILKDVICMRKGGLYNILIVSIIFIAFISGCTGNEPSDEQLQDGNEQTPQLYSLSIYIEPNDGGIVLKTPAPNADGTYASGTLVKLTAVPASGYKFNSWSGDLTGNSNPVMITMEKNKTITANFSKSFVPIFT